MAASHHRSRRPRMTAEEATRFEGAPSMASMTQVFDAIEARRAEGIHTECACNPYLDVFTFNRWKAQGLSVKKGERSLRVASWTPTESGKEALSQAEEGEQVSNLHLRPVNLCLFCRCQIEKREVAA